MSECTIKIKMSDNTTTENETKVTPIKLGKDYKEELKNVGKNVRIVGFGLHNKIKFSSRK